MPSWLEDDEQVIAMTEEFQEANMSVEFAAAKVYKEAAAAAIRHIDKFFANKQMHCGGSIPKRLLHAPQRVNGVVNYDISRAVDRAYEMLDGTISEAEIVTAKKMGDSTSDIKLVNETLKLLKGHAIPQQFAGGIMLMYLELVIGISVEI